LMRGSCAISSLVIDSGKVIVDDLVKLIF
jgi:hypothetical protein